MPKAKKPVSLENVKIDVKENFIFQLNNQLLEILLKDRTTNANLVWATSNYADRGTGYREKDHILTWSITEKNGNIIKPRIEKSKAIQMTRIKENAEVFTPSWVCNNQNNLIDQIWFGNKNIFNKETIGSWKSLKRKIPFKKGRSWQDYIKSKRMEITCGEAPYLVSRYDTTTGEIIPIKNRIGVLDRKLRVVSENTKDVEEWMKWATIAFQNTYGYDFQGDNVLLARENLLLTFVDYYHEKFAATPSIENLLQIADIISWNIWQMDGIKGQVPYTYKDGGLEQLDLFEPPKKVLIPIQSRIMNWDSKKTILYRNSKGAISMKFDVVVGNPPYQETVKEATTGNNKNAVDIFQYFQDAAQKIGRINCLIYPAKEYQRGNKNTLNKHLISLRIYNGSARQTEKNIPDEDAIFGHHVRRIPGDVGVFYWDNDRETEKIIYQDELIDRTDKILPVRKDLIEISLKLASAANTYAFSTIKKVCESNFVEKNPSSVLGEITDRKQPAPKGYSKVLTNNKAGSGGKSKWYYIKTKDLDRVQPSKYKVVISSAYPNEAFKNPDNLELLEKDEMFGRAKLSIYDTDDISKAKHFIKYMHTDFVRLIALMTPYKFLYYLPNFDDIYDQIDWNKDIHNIDLQLYKKYRFNEGEIELINSVLRRQHND